MAVLGLRFCARAFSSCGKGGPLFIAVRGPLTIAASLVAEHRLQTRRLSNFTHGLSCSAACGILPDQGSNPCPLHWQADSQPLRHQGSPSINAFWYDLIKSYQKYMIKINFFFLIEVELIYNVLLVSGVRKSDSFIYIYSFSYSFPL